MNIIMLKGKITMEEINDNLESFEMYESKAEVEEETEILKDKENKLRTRIEVTKHQELEKIIERERIFHSI